MSGLLVLCPSHRRPVEARRLYDTFLRTKTLEETRLLFLVWDKDPTRGSYYTNTVYCPQEDMTSRSNSGLSAAVGFDAVGWVADDNRFATIGWDEIVLHALKKTPIVFGNDVVSPGSKPSHVFIDARIPKALGWFMHPNMISTFQDDVWMHLGTGAGTIHPLGKNEDETRGVGIKYLPEVVVPHLYTERDNASNFAHDSEQYATWRRHGAEDDIARAKHALRRG